MSDDDDAPEDEAAPGAPAWVMTFADLMSLLMCFFVLLLSFSVIDQKRFKTIIGSMVQAFGLQRDIRAESIPKGTSIIKRDFTPGKPVPTTFDEIRQRTIQDLKENLERQDSELKKQFKSENTKKNEEDEVEKFKKPSAQKDLLKKNQVLAAQLKQEIKDGRVEVEIKKNKIILRISESGSFDSGMAEMKRNFKPLLAKINAVILKLGGTVVVAGHTDDQPVSNALFRSNWDLSSLRAASVTQELLLLGDIPKDNISIAGFAETKPLVDNDSPENRSKNRRVEIIIEQGGSNDDDDNELSIVENY